MSSSTDERLIPVRDVAGGLFMNNPATINAVIVGVETLPEQSR